MIPGLHEVIQYKLSHTSTTEPLLTLFVRRFGLHVGWAIEGAIGSDLKVDFFIDLRAPPL
jgi:hypothetical protein